MYTTARDGGEMVYSHPKQVSHTTFSDMQPPSLPVRLAISAINTVGEVSVTILKCSGKVLFTAALGAVAGMAAKINPQLGFIQGAVVGGLSDFVIQPIGRQVSRYTGEGAHQIHRKGQVLLATIGMICVIAIPAFITKSYGSKAMEVATKNLPTCFRFLINRDYGGSYTFMKGILTSTIPVLGYQVMQRITSVGYDPSQDD